MRIGDNDVNGRRRKIVRAVCSLCISLFPRNRARGNRSESRGLWRTLFDAKSVIMKATLVAFACSTVVACASNTSRSPATAPSASARPTTPDEVNCRRSLSGPGKRKEGEDCGGSTNISCAEGLTCVSAFKCEGAIGKCQKP